MAQFDLGTLYQKLTLDISEFLNGIKQALQHVDILRSDLEKISHLKFNLQTNDAQQQMRAFSLETEKAKATYASFLDNLVRGRLKQESLSGEPERRITPENVKSIIQESFVDIDEYIGNVTDKVTNIGNINKRVAQEVTNDWDDEMKSFMKSQQDASVAFMNRVNEQLRAEKATAREIARTWKATATEISTSDKSLDLERAKRIRHVEAEQSRSAKEIARLWETNTRSREAAERQLDVERLRRIREQAAEQARSSRETARMWEANNRSREMAERQLDVERLKRIQEQAAAQARAAKESAAAWANHTRQVNATDVALNKQREARIRAINAKLKESARAAAESYDLFMDEVFRGASRAKLVDVSRLEEWKREMRRAGKEIDETTMSVTERTRSRFTAILAEMTKKFGEFRETGTGSLGAVLSGILKSAAGFAIAMAATRLLTSAVQSLIGVVRSATTTLKTMEDQAIALARSITTSGRRSSDEFHETSRAVREVIPWIRRLAAEVNVPESDVMLLTQRFVEMGHSIRDSARAAQLLGAVSKTAYGESSQFWVLQQEMIELFKGDLNNAKFIVNQIGAEAAQAVQKLAQSGDLEGATKKLADSLGVSVDYLEDLSNSLGSIERQLMNAWEETVANTTASQAWAEVWELTLKSIIHDLRTQGTLWTSIQLLLNTASLTIGAISLAINTIKFPLDVILRIINNITSKTLEWIKFILNISGIWASIKSTLEKIPDGLSAILAKMVEMMPFSEKIRAAWDAVASAAAKVKGFVWDVPEIPSDVVGVEENRAKLRNDALRQLNELNIEIDKFLKVSKEQLEVEQAAVDLQKSQIQYGADAVVKASAELDATKKRNALEGQILLKHNELLRRKLELTKAAGDLTDKAREEITREIERNNEILKRLGIESNIAEVRASEEMALGRIARIQADTSNAQEVHSAFMELSLARLQRMRASEVDLERESARNKQIALNIVKEGIEREIALREQTGLNKDLEYQKLIAQKQSVEFQKEALRITTEINIAQIQLNQALERQAAAHAKIMEVLRSGSQLAQIGGQIEQIMAGMRLRAPIEEQQETMRIQLGIQQQILDLESASLAQERQNLEANLGINLAKARTAEEIENILLKYDQELAKLQGMEAINQRNRDLLAAQYQQLQNIERLELDKRLASGMVEAVHNFIEGFKEGQIKAKEFFQDLADTVLKRMAGENLERMINTLVTHLENGIEAVANKLASAFGQSSQIWVSFFHGLLSAGLAAISMLFEDQKAEVESLGDQVKDNIQEIERTRGLIAGETTIAIAQISENLSMAMRPTNDILLRMESLLKIISGNTTNDDSVTTVYSNPYATELLSSQRI